MTIREEVIEIINNSATTADAAENLLNSSRSLALYALGIGVEAIKSKERRSVRRVLKQEIQPQYVKGPVTGSVRLSKQSVRRMSELGDRLWLDWKIGVYSLGDMSREQLLAQVESEKKSAHGSLQNVRFYKALADPMRDGQLVKEHWSPETVKALKKRVYEETKDKRPTLR